MKPEDIKRLQVTHSTFLKDLAREDPRLIYEPGTRGIVMTAGFTQLPVLVISLRMLRRTECTVPVEVFLASDSDYDKQVCEILFPELGAKCVVLSDIIRASGTGVALETYQYKFMSLLFSSFEDVLILDSDAFPTRDPSFIFDDRPFNQTGMVLWPDFWFPSESPYFFEITGLDAPQLHARPAVESGEMMFSKQKHGTTLMLAAYYNYHSSYFYPLLSQGAPGQGDKDTFHWAATVINSNKSFYLVHEAVVALGHTDSNGVFVGSAMAQSDPGRDYEQVHLDHGSEETTEFGKSNAKPQQNLPAHITDPRHNNTDHTPPLFVHANFPKFDPSTIFYHGEENTARPLFDSNGTAVRAWLPAQEAIDYFGYDVERAFWAEIQYIACNWEGMFRIWEGRSDICYNVKMYRGRVFT
jgi:alpha 1,2-mannosyltransferase